jgi:hypothetical protein
MHACITHHSASPEVVLTKGTSSPSHSLNTRPTRPPECLPMTTTAPTTSVRWCRSIVCAPCPSCVSAVEMAATHFSCSAFALASSLRVATSSVSRWHGGETRHVREKQHQQRGIADESSGVISSRVAASPGHTHTYTRPTTVAGSPNTETFTNTVVDTHTRTHTAVAPRAAACPPSPPAVAP